MEELTELSRYANVQSPSWDRSREIGPINPHEPARLSLIKAGLINLLAPAKPGVSPKRIIDASGDRGRSKEAPSTGGIAASRMLFEAMSKGPSGPALRSDAPPKLKRPDAVEHLSPAARRIVNRLLEDPKFRPPFDPGSTDRPETWSTLGHVLAGMPFHFRDKALVKFEEGFRVFGKVPAIRIEPSEEKEADGKNTYRVVGPARPMGCPEPPVSGSEFILCWKEGDFWNWYLDDSLYDSQWLGGGIFQRRLEAEVASCLERISSLARSERERDRERAQSLLALLDSGDDPICINRASDLRIGFHAGMMFCRILLYSGDDVLDAELFQHSKSDWTEILVHALQRHGVKAKPEKLFELLGGVFDNTSENRRTTKRNRTISFPHWDFTPTLHLSGRKLYSDFSKKVSDTRDKRHMTT